MEYEGYSSLYYQIEAGAADRLLEEYFQCDGAVEVTTVEMPNEGVMLVRRYEREVVKNAWTSVTAEFLPANVPLKRLLDFLPAGKNYAFDEKRVDVYLRLHPCSEDREYVISALQRVGKVVYLPEGGDRYRGLTVHPVTGLIRSHPYDVLRERRR